MKKAQNVNVEFFSVSSENENTSILSEQSDVFCTWFMKLWTENSSVAPQESFVPTMAMGDAYDADAVCSHYKK